MSMTLSPPLVMDEQKIGEHHWTVDEFYRVYDAGDLDNNKRWELLQGRIIEKMTPGPRHSYLADAIAHMLRDALEPPLLVREEKSVRLAYDSELVPDVSVARGVREDYREHHPTAADTALVVEVADSSAVKDLGDKAYSYAQAGMTEYWVVLVNEDVIVVHRQPSPEGYAEVTRLSGADTLSPLARPEAVWTVNDLLGRGEAQQPRILGE